MYLDSDFVLLQVVKLHQKLGKPIPEPAPLKPPEPKETKENSDKKAGNGNKGAMRKQPPKKMAAPKITFVGGTKLTSTGLVKSEAGSTNAGVSAGASTAGTPVGQDAEMEEGWYYCFLPGQFIKHSISVSVQVHVINSHNPRVVFRIP